MLADLSTAVHHCSRYYCHYRYHCHYCHCQHYCQHPDHCLQSSFLMCHQCSPARMTDLDSIATAQQGSRHVTMDALPSLVSTACVWYCFVAFEGAYHEKLCKLMCPMQPVCHSLHTKCTYMYKYMCPCLNCFPVHFAKACTHMNGTEV